MKQDKSRFMLKENFGEGANEDKVKTYFFYLSYSSLI